MRSLWSLLGRVRYAALATLVVASVLLGIGLFSPIVYLRRGITSESYSVLTGITDLASGGNLLLAVIIAAFSVAFPIVKLAWLARILFRPATAAQREQSLRVLAALGRWSMLDVFVIAILVGSVRLGVLSEGEPRPGLYVFGAAILLSMIAAVILERSACPPLSDAEVDDFAARVRPNRALTALSAALFVLGLSLPLMQIEKWLFWENEYSLLGGAWHLAQDGGEVLACALLIFVVLLPLTGFAGRGWVQWGSPSRNTVRRQLVLEKWSMLDVFGLALLIVTVKITDIAAVQPRPGFWVLLVAVALSIYDRWRSRRT